MKKILSCLVLLLTCCSCSCANFTPKNKEPIESSETKSVLISNVTEPQTDIWCVGTSYPNEENYSLYYFDEYQKHLDNAELPDTFIHYDSLAFLGDLFAFEVPSNTTDFSEYIYTFSFDEKYYEQMQMSWSRNLLQVKIKHHVLTELTVPEATDTPPNTEYYIANNILYEEKNNKLASITLIHNQTEYRFSFIMQEGFMWTLSPFPFFLLKMISEYTLKEWHTSTSRRIIS